MAELRGPKYPIGVQSFRKMRNDGYVYVDKTAILYELARTGNCCFLSRPRRFGKSLMLSTLESYFMGEKELFKGLAMEQLEKDWPRHPVFHLDLSAYGGNYDTELDDIVAEHLQRWEKQYDVECHFDNLSIRLKNLIINAHEKTGHRAVILIDEYDAPMIAHTEDKQRLAEVRDKLRSVYMNLKICDEHIRFAMITGVSRFSKVSVFSGLNNLNDISLDSKYSEICGITEEEMIRYFDGGVNDFAKKYRCSYNEALLKLKQNYDGYHFTEDCPDIYNPFSLLNAFAKRNMGSYWYQSGKATMIVKRINEMNGLLSDILDHEEASETMLTEVESYTTSPVSLLFQAGYLTIKDYDPEEGRYSLGIPNKEVRQGLLNDIAISRLKEDSGAIQSRVWDIRRLLREGRPGEALEVIKSFLSRVPYDIMPETPELYFENNLYLIFSLVGIDVRTEWKHSAGRVDMVLMMKDYIYVMELKLEGTAEQALAQIEEKGYAAPYADDSRTLFRIGINFSKETRNIDTWLIA